MSLFKGLQDNQLDDIQKHMKQIAIKAGDSIIKDEEIGDVMYILLNGEAGYQASDMKGIEKRILC